MNTKKLFLAVISSFLVVNIFGESSAEIGTNNKRGELNEAVKKVDHSRKVVFISNKSEKCIGFLVNINKRIVIFTPASTILKLNKIRVKTFDGKKLRVKSLYFYKSRDLAIIPLSSKECGNLEAFSLADKESVKPNSEISAVLDSKEKTVFFNGALLNGGSDDSIKVEVNQPLAHGSPIITADNKLLGMSLNLKKEEHASDQQLFNYVEPFSHNIRLDNINPKGFRKVSRKNAKELELYRKLKEHNEVMMMHLNNFKKTSFITGDFEIKLTSCRKIRYITDLVKRRNFKFSKSSYNGNIAGENFVRKWNNWGHRNADFNPTAILIDLFNNMRVMEASIKKRKFYHKVLLTEPHLIQRELKIQNEMKKTLETIKINLDKAYKSYNEYYIHIKQCPYCKQSSR